MLMFLADKPQYTSTCIQQMWTMFVNWLMYGPQDAGPNVVIDGDVLLRRPRVDPHAHSTEYRVMRPEAGNISNIHAMPTRMACWRQACRALPGHVVLYAVRMVPVLLSRDFSCPVRFSNRLVMIAARDPRDVPRKKVPHCLLCFRPNIGNMLQKWSGAVVAP